MGEVLNTARPPEYYADIKTFGKCGETDFETNAIPSFMKQGATVFDVRDIIIYQLNDIDYVVDKEGGMELPPFDDIVYSKRYIKIEVKVDTRALTSGNLVYEVVSHGSSGWCVTTKCDWVYIVLTRLNTTEIVKRGWVNMKKWHEFCANRKTPKEMNYIKGEGGIVDMKCRMSDLIREGVMNWIEM